MSSNRQFETPETLTTGQASQALGVAVSTVRGMCERGELEGARRVGGWWRIPAASVEAYLPGKLEPA